MSSVIDFLARMGRDALLRDGSPAELDRALADVQVEPELRSAILAGNAARLQALLGQGPLASIMLPPDEGEGEEEDEDEDETGGPPPDGEPAARSGPRIGALLT